LNRPPNPEITLVHQDFRTGNYLLDENGLTGILDWEFAGWGDPMSDLGWFCAECWRFSRPDLEAGGIASRRAFYGGYEAGSGRTINDEAVRFWELMAHIRWAVIALQQAHRHLSGTQRSLELALTGRLLPDLELRVLDMTAPRVWRAA
jgi:aminoglycoside phosphotransferase (APT) family kinase protein